MPAFVGFIGGFYRASTRQADNEQSIGFFPEKVESTGGTVKASLILVSKPGLAFFADLVPPAPVAPFLLQIIAEPG